MGSAPSFDPNILTRPISDRAYQQQLGAARDYPQINRAIGSAYPVGSTFKIVTATAALLTGLITPDTTYDDTGTYSEGALVRRNAGGASYGAVSLRHGDPASPSTRSSTGSARS